MFPEPPSPLRDAVHRPSPTPDVRLENAVQPCTLTTNHPLRSSVSQPDVRPASNSGRHTRRGFHSATTVAQCPSPDEGLRLAANTVNTSELRRANEHVPTLSLPPAPDVLDRGWAARAAAGAAAPQSAPKAESCRQRRSDACTTVVAFPTLSPGTGTATQKWLSSAWAGWPGQSVEIGHRVIAASAPA